MSKPKKAQPPVQHIEVAQIVLYMRNNPNPMAIRFGSMKDAMRQFNKLNEAREKAWAKCSKMGMSDRDFMLSSEYCTMVVNDCSLIDVMFLVDVHPNNEAMANTQKRLQLTMQG